MPGRTRWRTTWDRWATCSVTSRTWPILWARRSTDRTGRLTRLEPRYNTQLHLNLNCDHAMFSGTSSRHKSRKCDIKDGQINSEVKTTKGSLQKKKTGNSMTSIKLSFSYTLPDLLMTRKRMTNCWRQRPPPSLKK